MFLTLFPSQHQPRLHVRRKEGVTQVSIIILYYNPFKKYFTHFISNRLPRPFSPYRAVWMYLHRKSHVRSHVVYAWVYGV